VKITEENKRRKNKEKEKRAELKNSGDN